MIRVLFVCLGNICRSPLAEGVFKKRLIDRGLEAKFKVDSAGTADYHVGDEPDPRSCQVAIHHGFTLDHLGRQFTQLDFERFDFILVMDESNLRDVLKLAGSNETHRKKVKLITEYDHAGKFGKIVPDPYYGNLTHFEKVYEQLLYCCDELISSIIA